MKRVFNAIAFSHPEFKNDSKFTQAWVKDAARDIMVRVDWSCMDLFKEVGDGFYLFDDKVDLPTLASRAVVSDRVARTPKSRKPAETSAPTADPVVQFIAAPLVESTFDRKVSKNSMFSVVPEKDTSYIPFGHFKDIERILKSKTFFPVFITGHSGNGKSKQVVESCARLGIPLIRMSITSQTCSDDLIGSKTLVDGNVVVEEGPVLVAMRSGCPILLDELDAAQANNIMCLQGILEGESFYFSLTGEYIKPQPGFNVFATGNTKGKGSDSGRYIGTNILNDAFLERFGVVFEQEFPNIAVEQKMIENWLSEYEIVDTQFSSELATWAQAIRKTFFDGGLEDLIATRRLKHIVKAYSIFRDKKKAIHLSTGRFDGMTADAFRKLFDKIHTEVVVA